jgi:hypothetical protein
MNRSLFSIAVALACVPTWPAEGTSQLPANVAACANIPDTMQRASCYDREVAALSKAPVPAIPTRPPSASPSGVAPPAPAPAPAPAEFGVDSLERKARATSEPASVTLKATVTSLREPRPGVYVITLDNGQVWRQSEPRISFLLKTGDGVSLKRGTLDAYRLWRDADGAKNWVRVSRVR